MYSKITLVALVIVIIFLTNAVWGVYKKQDLTKDNLAKTAANLESLQAREKMLSSEIDRLKTEGGTEAEIREKYGLVKPGEEVIVLVEKDDSMDSGVVSSNISFWRKVKDWFK